MLQQFFVTAVKRTDPAIANNTVAIQKFIAKLFEV